MAVTPSSCYAAGELLGRGDLSTDWKGALVERSPAQVVDVVTKWAGRPLTGHEEACAVRGHAVACARARSALEVGR